MIDEERLVAWLCGELHGSEADAVAAAVAADPALSARAAAHRAAEARLRAAFDPILAEPLPQALRDAVAGAAEAPVDLAPIDLAAVRAARQAGQAAAAAPAARRRLPVPYWAALAATLVIGVAIGNVVRPVAGAGPAAAIVASADGDLQAHGILAKALDTQLASATQPGPVRVALSFRDHADRLCRTWTIAAQSGGGQAGIACRTGEAWQIAASVAAPGQQAGAYRMAAGSSPQLAAAVEAMIAGDPLDAAAEQRARAAGWR